jgi:hypothetical protein
MNELTIEDFAFKVIDASVDNAGNFAKFKLFWKCYDKLKESQVDEFLNKLKTELLK